MTTTFLPALPVEGQTATSSTGRKLQFLSGVWRVIPISVVPAGLTGAEVDAKITSAIASKVTAAQVGSQITTAIADKVTAAQVGSQITTAINALELGTIATSDLFVSTAAPDNAIGKDGDIWLQTN